MAQVRIGTGISGNEMVGLALVLSIIWLAFYLLWVKVRKPMTEARSSSLERAWFGLIRGVVCAPGIMSGGHPPPIPVPVPFGALLTLLFSLWMGGHGEAGFFVICNLASLFATSAVSIGFEFIRFSGRKS